ncbi:hypothetical protein [Paenibacillus polymyxa]|uniref:hypothetical protein n=1 Tax=Paenibacillus polymyxa TaxID=1406 RepID=UPI0025B6C5DF|nr:hypothetical protein [Paenibacillus polymyxa]MDN4090963.1 hypothetical protein [Paenibacillus polymyxa]
MQYNKVNPSMIRPERLVPYEAGKETDYMKLKTDVIYTVCDSLGELHRYLFRGYDYCSDADDHVLIFWDPANHMRIVHWASGELQYAIIED